MSESVPELTPDDLFSYIQILNDKYIDLKEEIDSVSESTKALEIVVDDMKKERNTQGINKKLTITEYADVVKWVIENFIDEADKKSGIHCSKFSEFVEMITNNTVGRRKVRAAMRELGYQIIRVGNKEAYRGIRFAGDIEHFNENLEDMLNGAIILNEEAVREYRPDLDV